MKRTYYYRPRGYSPDVLEQGCGVLFGIALENRLGKLFIGDGDQISCR